ncbi:hypothetical protein ElyMa_005634900 [Elysia marginata]|uniref:Uncharacterized protein n=1 Tax=Elysia marginata TaxID=1093978 RepID=A0AAV4F972_9GAST|nr:hypothetical protein ElyMa_005634900 [Elysia marginata]
MTLVRTCSCLKQVSVHSFTKRKCSSSGSSSSRATASETAKDISSESLPSQSNPEVEQEFDFEPTHHRQLLLRTSLDAQQLDNSASLHSRRVDPATVKQVYYFDTLAFSKKLEASGK